MTGTVATQVKAIAFDRDIERLTEGFTGREWFFEEMTDGCNRVMNGSSS
jgi:hypothetical protein